MQPYRIPRIEGCDPIEHASSQAEETARFWNSERFAIDDSFPVGFSEVALALAFLVLGGILLGGCDGYDG